MIALHKRSYFPICRSCQISFSLHFINICQISKVEKFQEPVKFDTSLNWIWELMVEGKIW